MNSPVQSRSSIEKLRRYSDRLGWQQRLRSLDYFRCLEYGWILDSLEQLAPDASVLEWGVGTSPLPQFLACSRPTLAIDLDVASCAWQQRTLQRGGAQRLTVLRGNGVFLPLKSKSVDVAVAVGSLEHALEPGTEGPDYEDDRGDSLSLAELGRVLRPGGVLLLTVPWSPQFNFSAGSAHTPTFERRYDDRELKQRLIEPSGLVEANRRYFGEAGFEFSRLWYRLPFALKLPFRRLVPWASRSFLGEVDANSASHSPSGVFLRLEKPRRTAEGAS